MVAMGRGKMGCWGNKNTAVAKTEHAGGNKAARNTSPTAKGSMQNAESNEESGKVRDEK